MRTDSWINLQPAIYGSASLTKAWYMGLFYDEETLSNVPSLNAEEVLYTLSHIENRIINRADVSLPLLTQFKTPFWLQVYFKLKDEHQHIELNNPLLCYELISYFLERRVFMAKKSTEKIFLLKKISDSISEGNKKLRVSKEKILSYINCYPDAYEELINAGIIIEEKRLSTTIPTEIVRFLNDDIYTYFLFIQITDKFEYKPSKPFFEHILNSFSGQNSQRDHILNWSIRFSINRNEIAALKNIFRLPFSNYEKNSAFDFICYVSKYELSKPNSNFNKLSIGIDFIDIMATGRTMSNLYKETIKTISENVLNEDIQIMLHVIECNVNLIDVDKIALANTMQLLKRNYKRLNELFPINPYDLILYFYNNLINKPNESKSLEEKIIKLCQEIDQSKPMRNEEITSAEILTYRLVLIALFSQKNYAECHRFIMAILSKYPNIFYVRHSVFSPFLLLHLGQTYIKLNYFKKAQRIMQFVDKIISSDYTYHTNFILASFNVFKANFYNATHHYEQALIETNIGLDITRKNNFKMLEITLLLSKIDTLKHTEESEEVSSVIKELLNFLTAHKLSMPDYSNLSSHEFEHTFKILKSYRKHQNL
ncbi:tetratricopeptide repeat protein [Pedobacter sp. P26]|uniref:tetratricopeptide repeat protein n=1 Tax=Pedobacter sp. P26 TaxID=3423956 RepID=UPI003D66861A